MGLSRIEVSNLRSQVVNFWGLPMAQCGEVWMEYTTRFGDSVGAIVNCNTQEHVRLAAMILYRESKEVRLLDLKYDIEDPDGFRSQNGWQIMIPFIRCLRMMTFKNIPVKQLVPCRQIRRRFEREAKRTDGVALCSYQIVDLLRRASATTNRNQNSHRPQSKRLHRVRFHERYMPSPFGRKDGGWYLIPSHWRGDEALGVVITDRKA